MALVDLLQTYCNLLLTFLAFNSVLESFINMITNTLQQIMYMIFDLLSYQI